MSKVINIKNCELIIDKPQITLNRETKFLDLKKLIGYTRCYNNKSSQKFKHCDINKAIFDGKECHIEITFELDKIVYFKFGICPEGGWDGWSKENQIKVQNCNSEWLLKVTGKSPPYKSRKGVIDSVFDERSGSSYICFSYPQNRSK